MQSAETVLPVLLPLARSQEMALHADATGRTAMHVSAGTRFGPFLGGMLCGGKDSFCIAIVLQWGAAIGNAGIFLALSDAFPWSLDCWTSGDQEAVLHLLARNNCFEVGALRFRRKLGPAQPAAGPFVSR